VHEIIVPPKPLSSCAYVEHTITAEEGVEDELIISFTASQQAINDEQPEETLSSQNQPPEYMVTRSGRISKPPNRFNDYVRHS